MKKRNLWRALMAALLCVALLCPTLALAEDEGLEISAISGDDLGLDVATGDGLDLDVNETFDGALPNLPGLDLGSDLVLDDVLVPDETGPIALGGEAVSNEGGDAGEPVALGSRPDGLAFLEIASRLVEKLGKKD